MRHGDILVHQQRKNLLMHLLAFDRDLNEIRPALSELPWDSSHDLVVLSREAVVSVLQRFTVGDISRGEVEDWANCIECREDIGFEQGWEDKLKKLIFELANPRITRDLSNATANEWINALSWSA